MSLTCQVSSRWRWSTDPPRSHCVSLALGSWGASSDRTRGLRSVWRKPTGGKSSEKKYAHKLAKVASWMLMTFIQPPSLPGEAVGADSRESSSSCLHKLKEQHISRRFIIALGMNFPKAASNFPCCYFQNPPPPLLSSSLLTSRSPITSFNKEKLSRLRRLAACSLSRGIAFEQQTVPRR